MYLQLRMVELILLRLESIELNHMKKQSSVLKVISLNTQLCEPKYVTNENIV